MSFIDQLAGGGPSNIEFFLVSKILGTKQQPWSYPPPSLFLLDSFSQFLEFFWSEKLFLLESDRVKFTY